MINKYELNARIYPIIIALLPVLIIGIYFSIDYQNIYSALGGIGLITLLSFVFGQLGRDKGKRAEKKLWNEWGGAPTTQILRLTDDVLDIHTTKKAHKSLHERTSIGLADMAEIETSGDSEADEIYEAWCNYLRKETRDTSKHKLLFQENISYGFRRNLWGIKSLGIVLVVLSLIIITTHSYLNYQLLEVPNYSLWVSVILLILLLIFWLTIVTKDWIKIVAFAYAERLIEAIDQ